MPVSLRIFAVILVLTGFGSLLQVGLPIYRERMAIRTIESLGGMVGRKAGGPHWLRGVLEKTTLFDHVTWVDLRTPRATDATLAELNALPELSYVSVGKSQMTVAGVRHLIGLPKLSYVSLPDGPLTNWAVGELCRASPAIRVNQTSGREFEMRILPRELRRPQAVSFPPNGYR
jgi:hypothetical protein